MKAVIGDLPGDGCDGPNRGDGASWAFELKWDGMRIQASWTGPDEQVTLRSIRGRDVSPSFPELARMAAHIGVAAVLDGEVVVFDGERPSFGRLQHRMHMFDPPKSLMAEYPIVYMVFDLLSLDGRSLLELPYRRRRAVLTDLVDDGPSWRVPPSVEGGGGGQQLLALAQQRGLEGIVAKRLASTYQPGARSPDWIKIKLRRQQEFVVVGWLGGQGNLEGQIGSLLLGVWEDGTFHFAGAVGSGLGRRERARLDPLLAPEAPCPFDEVPALDRPPQWVEPTVVVEVEYGFWPADGLLRHPVFIGVRDDVDPVDVIRELPPTTERAR